MKQYRHIIQQWDKELLDVTHNHYFVDRGLQSQQLRRLIRQFSDLNPRELGWASQVSEVEAELRYQLRDEIRRDMLATNHPLAAFGLFILKFTTGYGTRPIYFVRTALGLLLGDALAFFLNDYFFSQLNRGAPACAMSQPHIHQWTDVLLLLLHYLYVAATTITSLGSDATLATYCGGGSTQILLMLSTIAGYFMLGLLGALLYTQLTQHD